MFNCDVSLFNETICDNKIVVVTRIILGMKRFGGKIEFI